jgi:hypothetical protein
MLHNIVKLNTNDIKGIPIGTKGTIVFEYSTGVYEVEFIINAKPVTETLTDEDIILL